MLDFRTATTFDFRTVTVAVSVLGDIVFVFSEAIPEQCFQQHLPPILTHFVSMFV